MSTLLSVLDLVPVASGDSAAAAVHRVSELALLAERLGYVRYWFAEHHSLPSVASAAPEVLIAHVAAATQHIRVGSGGIMLPNHAPLRIAESFQTLEALYPQRIDLGIGRAPGSEPRTSRALRAAGGEQFSALMSELLSFSRQLFDAGHPYQGVSVMPPDAPLPPVWILGSSGASAGAAGAAGMGYSFASHFSEAPAAPAFELYRNQFRPSPQFPRPHAILGVSVVCAQTDAEADRLATTMDLAWLRISRGEFLPLPSPEEAQAYPYTETERRAVVERRRLSVVGAPDSVARRLRSMAQESGADELMVVTNIHGHAARLRSYQLLAEHFSSAGG